LETAAKYRPDAVFLDIGLPGMDGYEIAEKLRELPEGPRAVLVAITGYGQDEDRRRSREAGIDHHLVKPVAPETLHELLDSLDRH
jgi:CheY-like chemotaxis protein